MHHTDARGDLREDGERTWPYGAFLSQNEKDSGRDIFVDTNTDLHTHPSVVQNNRTGILYFTPPVSLAPLLSLFPTISLNYSYSDTLWKKNMPPSPIPRSLSVASFWAYEKVFLGKFWTISCFSTFQGITRSQQGPKSHIAVPGEETSSNGGEKSSMKPSVGNSFATSADTQVKRVSNVSVPMK